jgi:hypothetical protein
VIGLHRLQAGDVDSATQAMASLVELPSFTPALLEVLVKDALRSSSLPMARAMLRRFFQLCHADVGARPAVDLSKLSVSSGDLLRCLIQLYTVAADPKVSANVQLERSIGQPCKWTHLNVSEGSEEVNKAGAPLRPARSQTWVLTLTDDHLASTIVTAELCMSSRSRLLDRSVTWKPHMQLSRCFLESGFWRAALQHVQRRSAAQTWSGCWCTAGTWPSAQQSLS